MNATLSERNMKGRRGGGCISTTDCPANPSFCEPGTYEGALLRVSEWPVPDTGNRVRVAAQSDGWRPIHVSERADQPIVINSFIEASLADHGSCHDHRDMVFQSIVVFIPCDDEQAIVSLRPLNIATQVGLQPFVPTLDAFGIGSIVHVVLLVGNDEAERR